MKIVFATNNAHKLKEIREILGDQFEIVSLKEIGCDVDIPETGNTLEENAHQKAEYIFDHYHLNCFADDTGLEGTDHDSEANMTKLLKELDGKENRKARFRTVISLITMEGDNPRCSREYRFEGIVNGEIATERSGSEGFGYDPVFVPEGYDKSFAELGEDIKNTISHRARAVSKLAEWLKAEE